MAKLNLTSINLAGLFVVGMAVGLFAATPQRTFDTPQAAVQATIDASAHNDVGALMDILGPGSKNLVESGDPNQDKDDRSEFVNLARQKMSLNQDSSNPERVTFTIGNEDWPFPVPLVRTDGKWRFDTPSGRMEILARQCIGENELNAIDACRVFVQAETRNMPVNPVTVRGFRSTRKNCSARRESTMDSIGMGRREICYRDRLRRLLLLVNRITDIASASSQHKDLQPPVERSITSLTAS